MEFDLRSLLILGERVEIAIGDARYPSKIESIDTDNNVLISQLTKNTLPVYVENERELKLIYFRESGMYSVNAVMRGSLTLRGIPLMRVHALSEPERHQQRNSFRLPMSASARLRWPRNDGSGRYALVPVRTVDFSATGAQVETSVMIPLSQKVRIDLSLDGETTLSLSAEAVRIIEADGGSGYRQIGFKFTSVSQRMQRILNKIVMNEQIRLTRRNR